MKNYTESSGSYKFLHKDYLGSILAISDQTGNRLEQRHFDAWGNLTHLKIGNNAVITDKNQIRDYLSNGNWMVDRGYTSHEHFAEVGIIHMNGRLYDPLLRRFLNADENIQDPHNTQNYNKYGYVMNNPLMYNDPSGEFSVLLAIGFAAFTSVASDYYMNRSVNIGNMFKSIIISLASAGFADGIGSVFSIAKDANIGAKILNSMARAGAHGFTQGVISAVQGGNFKSGFLSGVFASFAGDLLGAGIRSSGEFSIVRSKGFALLTGAVMGGTGSVLGGGNFWIGAGQGLIVTAFNYLKHRVVSKSASDNYVIAGINGAGGEGVSGNPDLKSFVEGQGGKMFTSSWGTNDQEIIDYLIAGHNEGKQIKIYGHSRGGAAAVRIANKLGEMFIHVAEVNLYDPVALYGGGDFVFEHPYVTKVNNYYQRNPTDHLSSATRFELANNPFKGSPVSAKFQWPVVNNVNLTGKYYNGVLINHINITEYAIKNP